MLIGGGFIGLEVAASARSRGCRVTVLDTAPCLLGRAVPEAIAARVHALHERQGVTIGLTRRPIAFERMPGGALAVVLDDGDTLMPDSVVAGIGIEPTDELARDAVLAVERGIVVNERLETSACVIYAAGDVVVFPSGSSGRLVRQETWHGAETQARVAARNILGADESYRGRRGSGRISTTRSCRWPATRHSANGRSRACSATTRKSISTSMRASGSSRQAALAVRRDC